MSRTSPVFRSPLLGPRFPPSPAAPAKPKVVSIPVHFVGSDPAPANCRISPAAAAARIQSAFRGFLVRKNVRIARRIEAEVAEIEAGLRSAEGMDRAAKDEKERVRINEMLMRLLFRLDSVRWVRDYRRRVIRRAIALQELLDSLSAARPDQTLDQGPAVEEEQQPDAVGQGETVESMDESQPMETPVQESEPDAVIGDPSKTLEESVDRRIEEEVADQMTVQELAPYSEIEEYTPMESVDRSATESVIEEEGAAGELVPHFVIGDYEPMERCNTIEGGEGADRSSMEVHQEEKEADAGEDRISTGWELLETKGEKKEESAMEEEESAETAEGVEEEKVKEVVSEEGRRGAEERGVRDVMERMVTENEKLKGLVAELCERSAQQCKLMGGLAKRVEHLEKVVEKMERRKKKRKDSSSPASTGDKKFA